MQQTQTYNLNLIETSDAFSPEPLNDNAQKIESAFLAALANTGQVQNTLNQTISAREAAIRADLSAETAARQSADAALSQRVTALEARRIVFGSYKGNNSSLSFQLGFTPTAVLVSMDGPGCYLLTQQNPLGVTGNINVLRIVEGGFIASQGGTSSTAWCGSNHNYFYLALLL